MHKICPNCYSRNVIKKGTQKKIFETVQRLYCKECKKWFSKEKIKSKSYPIKVIMKAISIYNLGHTLKETSKLINQRYKVKTKPSTIHNWLKEFSKICTYKRIRSKAIKKFKPRSLVFKKTFMHNQPYNFGYHKFKVDSFVNEYFNGLKNYIINAHKNCPNELFMGEEGNERSSKLNFKCSVKINKKDSYATKLAELALNLAGTNKERHEVLQEFMLLNDVATLAIEVPVYLLKEEANKFKVFKNLNKDITGHVDLVQVKFGKIYLLDYKPDAIKENKEKVVSQLFSYALALSVRTEIWLRNFRCAWFDDNGYYEFNPNEVIFKTENLIGAEKKKYFGNWLRDSWFTSKEFNLSKRKKIKFAQEAHLSSFILEFSQDSNIITGANVVNHLHCFPSNFKSFSKSSLLYSIQSIFSCLARSIISHKDNLASLAAPLIVIFRAFNLSKAFLIFHSFIAILDAIYNQCVKMHTPIYQFFGLRRAD